jgi:cell shape-determining protein MreC
MSSFYFRFLKENRYVALQLIISIVVALVAGGIQYYQYYKRERLREQNLKYEKQLEILDQVQQSIDNLKNFVNKQREQLKSQQDVLETLKSEKKKLEPIVKADRDVVESLFRIQAERNKSNIWVDRLVGFLLGIVGSLLASMIWTTVRRRRSNP